MVHMDTDRRWSLVGNDDIRKERKQRRAASDPDRTVGCEMELIKTLLLQELGAGNFVFQKSLDTSSCRVTSNLFADFLITISPDGFRRSTMNDHALGKYGEIHFPMELRSRFAGQEKITYPEGREHVETDFLRELFLAKSVFSVQRQMRRITGATVQFLRNASNVPSKFLKDDLCVVDLSSVVAGFHIYVCFWFGEIYLFSDNDISKPGTRINENIKDPICWYALVELHRARRGTLELLYQPSSTGLAALLQRLELVLGERADDENFILSSPPPTAPTTPPTATHWASSRSTPRARA